MGAEQVSRASEGTLGPALIEVVIGAKMIRRVRDAGLLDVELEAYLSAPKDTQRLHLGDTVRFALPPRVWDRIIAACHRGSVVNVGAVKSEEVGAAAAAVIRDRIMEVLERMARHPGYRGRGVRGTSRVALPAFRCKGVPKARWWPTPAMAVKNATTSELHVTEAVLEPWTRMVRGSLVTTWVASDVREGVGPAA